MKWQHNNTDFDESLVGSNWGFIYLIHYPHNGGTWYCGKRTFWNATTGYQSNWRKYVGSGRIVSDYKSKYGVDWILENAKRFIIEVCPTHEIAMEREKHYIARLKARDNIKHWNLAEGGLGGGGTKGRKHTEDHKEKIRQSLLGRKRPMEFRKNIANALKKSDLAQEHRLKNCENQKKLKGERLQQMLRLKSEGDYNNHQLADYFNVSHQTITRYWNRHREQSSK